VLRVNGAPELPDDLAGTVGVIAGASAPESLVEEVLVRLAPARGTEEVRAVPEDEYFPLPRELREVLRTVAGALAAAAFASPAPSNGAPSGHRPIDGRDITAARVLAALS
jgi:4-hydroxy-3-methylbut-2-enyl diphosphate reductase